MPVQVDRRRGSRREGRDRRELQVLIRETLSKPAVAIPAGVAAGILLIVVLFTAVFGGPDAPPVDDYAGPIQLQDPVPTVADPVEPVRHNPEQPEPLKTESASWPEPEGKIALKDVVDRFRGGVVAITSVQPRSTATGTGFVVSGGGLIITNHHVIKDAEKITLAWEKGLGIPHVSGVVLHADASSDLAVLQVAVSDRESFPFDKLTPIPMDLSNDIGRGHEVVVLGFPLSSSFGQSSISITRGIVTGFGEFQGRTGMRKNVIRTDAQVSSGNSGGPLLDLERGCVIGVIYAKGGVTSDAAGYGFALPVKNAIQWAPGYESGPRSLLDAD
jgi:S1-C subfamily serine protease